MTAIKRVTIFFLWILSAASIAKAQKKITEGTITYSMAYDLPADKQVIAATLPTEVTFYFRGDSSAAIFNQGVATVKGVSDFKANFHSLLIDIPSSLQKIAVVLTPAEIEQEKAAIPQLTGVKGTEKQVIDGYNCTKEIVTDPKTGATYETWITNDIDLPPNSVSKPVSIFGGVPVKFITFNSGLTIKAEIKEIKEVAVPVGFFTPTKDYQPMTYTELKAMGGKN